MIGARKHICIHRPLLRIVRQHRHKVLASVVFSQLIADLLSCRLARKEAVVKHDGCRHALVIIVHDRHEDRRVRKSRYLLHLRDMLMAESEPIDARSGEFLLAAFRLILSDHLLAAARISGEGIAGDRVIRRKNTHADKRGNR